MNAIQTIPLARVTALMLQKTSDAKWDDAKAQVFPYVGSEFEMPCGYRHVIPSVEAIKAMPIQDIPCPCGNPVHWLVQFNQLEAN